MWGLFARGRHEKGEFRACKKPSFRVRIPRGERHPAGGRHEEESEKDEEGHDQGLENEKGKGRQGRRRQRRGGRVRRGHWRRGHCSPRKLRDGASKRGRTNSRGRTGGGNLTPGAGRRPRGPSYHLYLVGLGIHGAAQVTRETEAILRRCTRVYYAHADPTVADYSAELGPRVVNVARYYADARSFRRTYEAIAAVVTRSAAKWPPVALATYGHPLVYVSVANWLLERLPRRGLRVKALPAVSALDCLFVDLRLNPADAGLQMYDANDLLLKRRPLQPDVPCLIWQPGIVESTYDAKGWSRPQRFHRLRDYLLGFYAKTHEVIVAVSANVSSRRAPRLKRVGLGRLETACRELDLGGTLFIPPTHSRPVADESFGALALSRAHVRGITYAPARGTAPRLSVLTSSPGPVTPGAGLQ
jgi:precorrin-3B methylase